MHKKSMVLYPAYDEKEFIENFEIRKSYSLKEKKLDILREIDYTMQAVNEENNLIR